MSIKKGEKSLTNIIIDDIMPLKSLRVIKGGGEMISNTAQDQERATKLLLCVQKLSRLSGETQEQILQIVNGMCIMAQLDESKRNPA